MKVILSLDNRYKEFHFCPTENLGLSIPSLAPEQDVLEYIVDCVNVFECMGYAVIEAHMTQALHNRINKRMAVHASVRPDFERDIVLPSLVKVWHGVRLELMQAPCPDELGREQHIVFLIIAEALR